MTISLFREVLIKSAHPDLISASLGNTVQKSICRSALLSLRDNSPAGGDQVRGAKRVQCRRRRIFGGLYKYEADKSPFIKKRFVQYARVKLRSTIKGASKRTATGCRFSCSKVCGKARRALLVRRCPYSF